MLNNQLLQYIWQLHPSRIMYSQSFTWLQLIKVQNRIYKSKSCEVYKVNLDGKDYAIKRVQKILMCANNSRQFDICKKLKNQSRDHIVKIIDVCEDQNKVANLIVMEYYPWNLSKFIEQQASLLKQNPALAIDIFLQICFGLVNLNRMHRDIKSSNVLVKLEGSHVKVVITDFNECNNGQVVNSSRLGTYFYMAPEIKKRNSQIFYNSKVDVWSLALVLYQIMSVFEIYTKKNHYLLRQFPEQIKNYLSESSLSPSKQQQFIDFLQENKPSISKQVPNYMRQIMRVLINVKQEERPNLFQIIQYLTKNKDEIQKISSECKQFKIESYKKLDQYKDKQYKQEQKSIVLQRRIHILRKLYLDWYCVFCVKQLQNQIIYDKLAFYIYNGIYKIVELYDSLVQEHKVIKPELMLQYIFDNSKINIEDVKAQKIALKAKIGYYKKAEKEVREMGRQLINHQRLNKIIRQKFDEETFQKLEKTYRLIFE